MHERLADGNAYLFSIKRTHSIIRSERQGSYVVYIKQCCSVTCVHACFGPASTAAFELPAVLTCALSASDTCCLTASNAGDQMVSRLIVRHDHTVALLLTWTGHTVSRADPTMQLPLGLQVVAVAYRSQNKHQSRRTG